MDLFLLLALGSVDVPNGSLLKAVAAYTVSYIEEGASAQSLSLNALTVEGGVE